MGWGTRLGGDRPDTRRHFLATTSAASCLPTIFLPRTNFYPDNTTTGALHHYFLPPLTICIVRLPEKMMRQQECIEFFLSAEGRVTVSFYVFLRRKNFTIFTGFVIFLQTNMVRTLTTLLGNASIFPSNDTGIFPKGQ